MPSQQSDRNLLFGILALQLDFISRDDLVEAMNAWVLDKSKSLSDILLGRGVLEPDINAVLVALVDRHLERHGGDAQKSLAAVANTEAAASIVRAPTLSNVDPDWQVPLSMLAAAATDRNLTKPASESAPKDDTQDPEYVTPSHGQGKSDSTGEFVERVVPVEVDSGIEESSIVRKRVGKETVVLFGDYQLHEQLGRGGMGVVYRATQRSLKRVVALKMIRSAEFSLKHEVDRFRAEAEAAARLDHPNIVPVYEIGEHKGQHYFSMGYVEGQSLGAVVKNGPIPPKEAAALVEQCARAVQHAHDRGIVHRDLKPANILLAGAGNSGLGVGGKKTPSAADPARGAPNPTHDAATRSPTTPGRAPNAVPSNAGTPSAPQSPSAQSSNSQAPTPKIADFGLAKRLDAEHAMTHTGDVLGTPGYMAPEQASGKRSVGPLADVYSLGAVLYHLVTGRPPFQAASAMETLVQVLETEPVSIRSLNPAVSIDLETICHKCLQKDAGARYASADELAADLRRFLNGEPIKARPFSRTERLARWTRRNPVVAGLTAAVATTLLLGISISTYFAIRSNNAAHQASIARTAAEKNAQEANERAASERREKDLARRNLYAAHLNMARTAWETADVGRTVGLLDPYRRPTQDNVDLRGFEWHYLDRLCHLDLRTLDFKDDWPQLALSGDCQRVAIASDDGSIKVYGVASGQVERSLTKGKTWFDAVTFSGDGQRIAAVDSPTHQVTIWDASSGKEILTTAPGANRPFSNFGKSASLVFSPDRRWFASVALNRQPATRGGEVIVWDTVNGRPSAVFKCDGNKELFEGLSFDPTSSLLATRSHSFIKVWNVTTGKNTLTIASSGDRSAHFSCVAFSPNGLTLACAGANRSIELWSAVSGTKLRELKGHTDRVESVAFSPDSQRLVSGGWDATIRVWNAESGNELLCLRGHSAGITDVAFSSDGWQIASVDRNGVLKVWDSNDSSETCALRGHRSNVICLAFSPDGRLLASGSEDRTVRIWETSTKRLVRTLPCRLAAAIAFSPDGQLVAIGDARTTRIWKVRDWEELPSISGHTNIVSRIVFSPDGRRIATSSRDPNGIHVWDLGSRNLVWREENGKQAVGSDFAFSSDSHRLACNTGRQLHVWDLGLGSEAPAFKGKLRDVLSIVYSPDGRNIVCGCDDGAIHWLDAKTGAERRVFRSFADRVENLSFAADGNRLLSSQIRELKLWDTVTGQEVWTFGPKDGHTFGSAYVNVALSPDSSVIAYADDNKIALLEGTLLTPDAKALRDATGLVQYLFNSELSKEQVLERLRAQKSIDEPVREKALRLAQEWQPDIHVDRLNDSSWRVVKRHDAKPQEYLTALRQAEAVCQIEPENGAYLNTLGVAQYRAGMYDKALATLTKSEKLNARKGISDPSDLAFMAMAQFKLGRTVDASATLVRCRNAVKGRTQVDKAENEGFLGEAEALIVAKPASPPAERPKSQPHSTGTNRSN